MISTALVYTLNGEYGDILCDSFDMASVLFPGFKSYMTDNYTVFLKISNRVLPVQIFALTHPHDSLFFFNQNLNVLIVLQSAS